MATRGRQGRRPVLAVVTAAVLTLAAACSGGDATPAAPSSTTTRPAAPHVDRPSGLPWDSGVVGHDVARTRQFEKDRGRRLDVLGVSPTRDSWQEVLGTWWLEPSTIPAGFAGTLNVAAPLFPDDGNLADAAAGKYDEQWRQLAKVIAKRYPTAYVRPGWEMNIHNWKWSANPGNVEQYKQAFRHASQSMKSVAPKLRIVWNVNEGKGDSLPDASLAWPGDDVVDVVGLDAYDWSPPYDQKGWDQHRTKDQGWDYWARFAREHGKRFALPEWGVIAGNENSGGDNPAFVSYAYSWMRDNADIMAFESYFDETEDYCRCALQQNPKARDAYHWWMTQLGQ